MQDTKFLPEYRPDDLGVLQVVANSMSATTPFTVVAGVVTTGYAITGQIGIPVMFVAIAALLALFAGGFVAMARTMENAANVGGLYAYVARGLGRPVAVGSAWSAVIAYNALQVGLYGLVGAAASPIVQQIVGSDVPWWSVALVLWAVVAVLGTRRVAFNTRVLIVLLIAEVAVIVLYSLANLSNPADGVVTYDGILPTALLVPAAGAICGLAWVGFVGVESPVVYSKLARDPRRTIPRAMYWSIGLTAVLYAVSSWAMAVAAGPDQIVAASQVHQADLIFFQAGQNLGQFFVDAGRVLFVTSLLAAAVSFHLITAQYVQALGRERIMPAVFARRSARTGSPIYASFLQSGVGLATIITWMVTGWDPLIHLFFGVGASGGIGVLLVITLTALAVAGFFAREHDQEARIRRLTVAVLAAIGLMAVSILAVTNLNTLLGVVETSPLGWMIPAIYGAITLLGTVWGFMLRTRRPDIYRGIGSGAHGLTTPHHQPGEEPSMPEFDITVVNNEHQLQAVAEGIADAFADGELAMWLVPHAGRDTRHVVLTAHIHLHLRLGWQQEARPMVLGDNQATAFWVTNTAASSLPDDYRQQLQEACGTYTPNFYEFDQLLAEHHPTNYPHDHLVFMAVDPEHQRRRLGSTLLARHLAELDRVGRPAYLEATSPEARTFYQGHGFVPLRDSLFLPDGGPPLWLMWREPRPAMPPERSAASPNHHGPIGPQG